MDQAPPRIFDADARQRALARGAARTGSSFLLAQAAALASDRLADTVRRFTSILVSGGGRDLVRARADETLCQEAGDPPFDAILSLMELHADDDPVGALIRANHGLRPDGLFIGVMLGGETLHELRTAMAEAEVEIDGGLSPRVFPFADVRDGGMLLQRAGFALPASDRERFTLRYSSFTKLISDLRDAGESNTLLHRRKKPVTRAMLLRAADIYAARFSDNGRLVATFDFIVLTGWAPDASQPKPLRPGSARTRLADALGVKEINAGEKAGPG